MSAIDCETCLYTEICSETDVCEDYTPVGDTAEDAYYGWLIELRRQKFMNEWFTMMEEVFAE